MTRGQKIGLGLGIAAAVALGGAIWWRSRPRVWLGRELIPGGESSGMSPAYFDPRQLRIGTKVELEHTPDRRVAREIAMDHLVEDPAYYTKLVRAGL